MIFLQISLLLTAAFYFLMLAEWCAEGRVARGAGHEGQYLFPLNPFLLHDHHVNDFSRHVTGNAAGGKSVIIVCANQPPAAVICK